MLATVCAWSYAILWGVSFYATLYLNYKLRNADSISLDTMVLNITGYLCYSYSILLQLINNSVRSQYQMVFDRSLPLLSAADLFYSSHGLLLQLVLFTQIFFGKQIWGFNPSRTSFKISSFTKFILFGGLLFLVFEHFTVKEFQELNFALNLSVVKIIISLIKYIPQVLYNMERRSMYGISKIQLYFDIGGAVFCLAEFFSKNKLPLVEAVYSNRGKVGIAVVTLFFGTIFLIQFYLYPSDVLPDRKKIDEEISLEHIQTSQLQSINRNK